MSELSREDVVEVAKLSRLALTDDKIDRYTLQLSQILKYIDKLNELDVDDVIPMVHANELVNVLREDIPESPLSRDQALMNAPHGASVATMPESIKGKYFTVPKVLGQGGA